MSTSETGITETPAGQPTYLDECDSILPRMQTCHFIRFTQMLLLTPIKSSGDLSTGSSGDSSDNSSTGSGDDSTPGGFPTKGIDDLVPGGFLTVQRKALWPGSTKKSQEAIKERGAKFRKRLEQSLPITSAIASGSLPDPKQGLKEVGKMREALRTRGSGQFDPGFFWSIMPVSLWPAGTVVRAYASSVEPSLTTERRLLAKSFSRLELASINPFDLLTDPNEFWEDVQELMEDIENQVTQPIDSERPQVVLCAEFEQRWCHLGYTRGEKVATIALAPGEEITLEVHSWIKETIKSERELLAESETRLTNKLTARDHIEVADELAGKGHYGTNSKIDLTIPVEGIPVTIGGGTDISGDLANTLNTTMQQTTEDTREAVNVLRSTRKLRIEENRETGRDDKQLRKVVNTNRYHTLNVHYFEVLSNYEVSFRLVRLRPCLLLPTPQPTVTPKWVLCNAHTLKTVLLDKTFLPGFEAAKILEMQAHLEALQSGTPASSASPAPDGGEGSGVEGELGRLRSDILAAYKRLKDTYDDSEDALDDLANINLLQWPSDLIDELKDILVTLGDSTPRLIYWGLLEVNADAFSALRSLNNSTGRLALESLRAFFTSVTPRDYQFNIVAATLAEALDALGLPEAVVTAIVTGGLIDFAADDAGLFVAVKAAHERLKGVTQQSQLTPAAEAAGELFNQGAADPAFQTELDGFTNLQLAEAKVEYARLECHINHNRDHYFHALLSLVPGGSMTDLYGYETLVSFMPVGFVGQKAAFPLRKPQCLNAYFDPDSLQNFREFLQNDREPLTVTMPTPGPIAEVTLGKCCGCEKYIVDSRASDTRGQIAEARQKEAEADRRFARLAAGDLGPFEPCCDEHTGDEEVENVNV